LRKERVSLNQIVLRKSIALAVVVLILSLNLSSTGILVGQGAKSGPEIGKFLTIDFSLSSGGIADSTCSVTATKDSGQTFTFIPITDSEDPGYLDDLVHTQKVGAGTVLLEAHPDTANGWEFMGWDDSDVSKIDDYKAEYKTTKLNIVKAIFERRTVTVYCLVDGPGRILFDGEIVASPDDQGDVAVPVMYGSSPTFTFEGIDDNHLSAVLVDSEYVSLDDTQLARSLTFVNIDEDKHLDAVFSPNGIATVPAGDDVIVYLDQGASLTFEEVIQAGTALGTDLTGFYPGELGVLWSIRINVEIGETKSVLVMLLMSEEPTDLERADIVWCDFDGDGKITGQDVSVVAEANPSAPGDPAWNPLLDLTGDGKIDDMDVNLVNDYCGQKIDLADPSLWESIFDGYIDLHNGYYLVYGSTDHFSIFRAR
jgi:hypothetical protein